MAIMPKKDQIWLGKAIFMLIGDQKKFSATFFLPPFPSGDEWAPNDGIEL